MILFLEYPKCSTCKKAKRWLDEHHISYIDRDIVLEKPTKEELRKWVAFSLRDPRTFFNTSGNLYKELHLKDKLDTMSKEEQLELLSSNGMLVKRPLLITDKVVLSGFKEDKWKESLL